MSDNLDPDVERFIVEQIDTVPHLEALLLLYESGTSRWSVEDVAARLYVNRDTSRGLLDDLVRRKLISMQPHGQAAGFSYDSAWDPGGSLMTRVVEQYRRHLVQVTALIHAKAPASIRDFARAFRFKKE
jgi:hypothetical protein